MSWEQRWREMALAGGALAAAACADNAGTPMDAESDAISNLFCCNAVSDPCCEIAYCGGPGPDSSAYILCEQDRITCQSHDGFYETLDDGGLGCSFLPEAGPCCEANPDPCCTCGGPDAALDPAGCAGKMACQADGGTWNPAGFGACSFPSEAGPSDVGGKGDGYD